MSLLSSHYPELSAKEIQQTVNGFYNRWASVQMNKEEWDKYNFQEFAKQLLIYEKRKAQLIEKAYGRRSKKIGYKNRS